ncbi:MAG TPA: hydrogenase maturation protease [Gammaproteobacteria bacterium]
MQQQDGEKPVVAIIGVGSPLGGDRLGWLAVDALQGRVLAQRFAHLHLTFVRSDRPGALLLEQLRKVDAAVIIDAMHAGLPPGTLRNILPEQLGRESLLLSSHGFGVAEALALAAVLGELPERLTIFGIEMGEELTGGALPERVTESLCAGIAGVLSSM